jgi:branched-chain amino acid aminotransferase
LTYLYYNGEFIDSEKEIITADSRGLRYGDGVFETIKVLNGSIQLASSHYERLFHGLQYLEIPLPPSCTASYLSKNILELCRKNKVEQLARVRLAVYRGKGTLYKTDSPYPDLVIQAEALAPDYCQFNVTGLAVDVCTHVQKNCDVLSRLKSNNYLPYVIAALHAKKQQVDDCLLINIHGRVCDSTIANLFWVAEGKIFTPSLWDGCVNGVMRRYLLESIKHPAGVYQLSPTIRQLEEADEIFLTNALFGIRWVRKFRNSQYSNTLSSELYRKYIKNFQRTEPT